MRRRNFLTGRIEYVDKDELFASTPALEAQLDHTVGSTFRIAAYTAGYTRDIGTFKMIETGIGANASVYALPADIKPYYGDRPVASAFFCGLSEAQPLKIAFRSRGFAASFAKVNQSTLSHLPGGTQECAQSRTR